jgi:uncharacterized protein YecE (DUF72 family)
MPRPSELFDTGNPITADFTYVRWIGDRKGIEELTKIWNQTIVDRTEELREWVKILRGVSRQVKIMFAYANNHFGGYASDTVELFKRLWTQEHTNRANQSKGTRPGADRPAQQTFGFRKGAGLGSDRK